MGETANTIKLNIYLSYPIDRDKDDIVPRLKKYIDIGTEIRAWLIDWEKLFAFPKMHLYVPAEHEYFVSTAYRNNFITKQQINFINREILSHCDLLILFGNYDPDYEEVRCLVECAQNEDIPIYNMSGLEEDDILALNTGIKIVCKQKGYEVT